MKQCPSEYRAPTFQIGLQRGRLLPPTRSLRCPPPTVAVRLLRQFSAVSGSRLLQENGSAPRERFCSSATWKTRTISKLAAFTAAQHQALRNFSDRVAMTFAEYRRAAETTASLETRATVSGQSPQCTQALMGGLEGAAADSVKLGIPNMLQDALNAYARHDSVTARRV